MEAITRDEKLMDGQDVKPITRKEKILAGEDLKTITREEYFLKKYRGGGGDITVESLNVTENGTYQEQGKAYSPVIVNVSQITEWDDTSITNFSPANNMTKTEIPEGITSIKSSAFDEYIKLSEIILPENLEEVGYYAFRNCTNLNKVILKAETPPVLIPYSGTTNYPFDSVGKYIRFYVPDNSINDYKNAQDWERYKDYILPMSEIIQTPFVREWDFTGENPLIDKINGDVITANNVSFENGCATLNSVNGDSYLKMPQSISFFDNNNYDWAEYEIDYKRELLNSGRARLFVTSNNFGSSNDQMIGLVYWQNTWDYWITSSNSLQIQASNYFNNSKIKIKLSKRGVGIYSIEIYKNNEIVTTLYNKSVNNLSDFTTISLGSHRGSWNCELNGFKVTMGRYS